MHLFSILNIITKGRHPLLLVMIFLFITSCGSQKESLSESIDVYLTDSLWLPINSSQSNGKWALYQPLDDSTLVYWDYDKDKFYYYNYYKKAFTDSLAQKLFDPKSSGEIFGFSVGESKNLIWVSSNNIVYIRGINNELKSYDINTLLHSIDEKIYCITLNPAQRCGGNIIITACFYGKGKDGKTDYNSVMHYYDVVFKLVNDSIVYVDKYNPNTPELIDAKYKNKLWRKRLMTSSSKILYVYPYKDTLIQYDLTSRKVVKRAIGTNSFTPVTLFEESKTQDAYYSKNYECSQSTFRNIVQNSKDSAIYLTLKHKDKYVLETGEKQEIYDANYSLLIYDKNLSLKTEIIIPAKKYHPETQFVLNGKLFIPQYRNNPTQNGKIMYYVFSIPDANTL